MSALRTLRVGAPTRRIGVSPVSDLARRRASLPTDAGCVAQLPNCRRSRSWPETGFGEMSYLNVSAGADLPEADFSGVRATHSCARVILNATGVPQFDG